jgi:hypothetical protein
MPPPRRAGITPTVLHTPATMLCFGVSKLAKEEMQGRREFGAFSKLRTRIGDGNGTYCAFAAWAASTASLVRAPAEIVAVPDGRSTVTLLRRRRLIIMCGLPVSFWSEEDSPWVPDWTRNGIL